MGRRIWLVSTVGILCLLAGVLVFINYLAPSRPPPSPTTRPPARPGPFDGERAVAYLSSICDLGPRISGSDGMTKQQELLQKHFEKLGAKVTLQKFDGKQPSRDKAVPMANMIVSWHPESKTRVIICRSLRHAADRRPGAERPRLDQAVRQRQRRHVERRAS